ncbi:hypothetical protein NCCP1664_28980 [Zafaria cholistanensis]|uniref:Cardiolipin synthase N-terminal domain-containing protein n=1 Tax=Zafaria cholistanensis TaxID=1682741 RepID=A0A5A7NUC3_9MICC|nr:PLD nuclease N-terminal domain-containing protein [Zafaria cholistanensis]GER24403.1 hypothetical protein NCCP1664_28980 [Zafaria cholistanensis]
MGNLPKGRQKKHWKDLTKGQRVRAVSLAAAQIALQSAAIRDITRRPASEVRGPKAAWIAATFINFAGPVAYFVLGRRRA